MNTEARIAALGANLKNMVYEYVCRSLFKVKYIFTHKNRANVAQRMSFHYFGHLYMYPVGTHAKLFLLI